MRVFGMFVGVSVCGLVCLGKGKGRDRDHRDGCMEGLVCVGKGS